MYMAALGLSKDPFSAKSDPKFYHEFDSFAQRLNVMEGFVRGTDLLVLIMGEPGSGKTTLLNRYLATSQAEWKPARIQTDPQHAGQRSALQRDRQGHPLLHPFRCSDSLHRRERFGRSAEAWSTD